MREDLGAVPPAHLADEEAGHQLGGRIQGDHAPVEVHRHDAAGERGQDVVRIRLEVGQLLEAVSQLGVRVLEVHALLGELGDHVVEGRREPSDLVVGRRLDPLVPLAARERGGALGQLLHRLGDAAGDDGGRTGSGQHRHDREPRQLQARAANLRLHPVLREPHAHGAPARAVHEDRGREVVDRPLAAVHRVLGDRPRRADRDAVDVPGEDVTDPLGVPAVRRHAAFGVERDRVDHVVLGGDARDVLLQRGEVVEEERPVRHRGEGAREDLATALDLDDDRGPLMPLDHEQHTRHENGDDEEGGPEQPRAQRVDTPAPHLTSQTLRRGM